MPKPILRIFVFLICLVLCLPAIGQSRKDLEKKRKKTQQEIKMTNDLLKQTQRDKKISMNQLIILNKKISARQELIMTISEELSLLNRKIEENKALVKSLEADLKKMKETYAQMVYNAYKNKASYNQLLFLLSATDFNQAYLRMRYLKLYTEFREKQIIAIKATQEILNEKLAELEEKKTAKELLVNDEKLETQQLSTEKNEHSKMVDNLMAKEKDLKKKLEQQKLSDQRLQKEINNLIAEDIRKAEEKRKKDAEKNKNNKAKPLTNTNNTKPNVFNLTPEEQTLSDKFEANQGKLPWPAERGIITGTYGEHEHPILKGIKVKNDGVYISTTQGAMARVIFDGVVSKIISIPGKNKAIIIRHGNYLTVYSNLASVTVSQGAKLKAKDKIGVIFTDEEDDGKTVLELQVWNGTTKMNPEYWLTKAH